MTEPEDHTLAYLRRIDQKLDSVANDVSELKWDRALFNQQRLTTDQRLLDLRFDRMDQRLERIEQRVGLIR